MALFEQIDVDEVVGAAKRWMRGGLLLSPRGGGIDLAPTRNALASSHVRIDAHGKTNDALSHAQTKASCATP